MRERANAFRGVWVCGMVLAAWCLTSGGAGAEVIDRVLAVVGGVVITQSDATAAVELGLVTIRGTGDPIESALSLLIERQLMLVEVDRYVPPEPAADSVDRRLQSIRARFSSAAQFDAMLARSGFDQQRLRQTIRDELRIGAYLDQRFGVPPLTTERRAALLAEWVSGLRRRADINYLYVPRR